MTPRHIVNVIPLSGFDAEGEPEIHAMSDGSLYVVFNFMPPSDAPEEDDLGQFANFDREMGEAGGVPVVWEDREVFVIRSPTPETVERVKRFVETYRARQS